MTLAEIISEVRALVNEISTDSGALLADAGNLAAMVNDAQEQVVLDLVPTIPDQLLVKENVTTIVGTQSYALTTVFLWITKVAKNTTNESPQEIEIIGPLDEPYHMSVSERADEPGKCYFIGNTLYFVPIPGKAVTNYATVWGVRPEAASMAAGGPSYLPVMAHRLIVYKAAMLVAVMLEADMRPFAALYSQRLQAFKRMWWGRFQSKPRFIRESITERTVLDDRDKAFYDPDWK